MRHLGQVREGGKSRCGHQGGGGQSNQGALQGHPKRPHRDSTPGHEANCHVQRDHRGQVLCKALCQLSLDGKLCAAGDDLSQRVFKSAINKARKANGKAYEEGS